jgi:DNA-binding transcriptional ArsR family regulator
MTAPERPNPAEVVDRSPRARPASSTSRGVVDLTRLLGLAQSTVSKHFACLRDCRLIDYRTEGRQSYYTLTHPELIHLLRSAELLRRRRIGADGCQGDPRKRFLSP